MSRSLPNRRITRMGGMYKKISSAGTRSHNQIDEVNRPAPRISDFEKEYQQFLEEQKALLAAKEAEEQIVKEVIVPVPETTSEPEVEIAPEETLIVTDVSETTEAPVIETVDVAEAVEEKPVKTSRKKKGAVSVEEA